MHGAGIELGSRLPPATYWRRCDEKDEGRYAKPTTVQRERNAKGVKAWLKIHEGAQPYVQKR
jgi:hypothetical protein